MITKDSPFPLYVQLAQYIRDKVRDGTFKPNYAIPSEFELAREFNVSRSTVRQAISELVHEGVLARVSGKGTYVSSDPFKQDFLARSGVIGLIQPYLRDSFFTLITLSIESTTRAKGYQLMLSITDNKYEQHQRSVRQLLSKKVDGLIIFLPDNYPLDEITLSLVEQKFNFVLIDRYLPGVDVSYVVSDNFGGAYQAVEHLIKLGHRRIGFVTRPSLQTTSVRDRVEGYRRALLDHGLPFDQSLVCDSLKTSVSEMEFFGTARGNSLHDVEVIAEFLKHEERPSAIFAVNDLVALATLEAASRLGLRIPEDIALVGFDDIDIVSHLETPLTTVAQDKYAIGAQAAQLLIDKIEGKEKGNRQIVVPTKLIVRRSCGTDARD